MRRLDQLYADDCLRCAVAMVTDTEPEEWPDPYGELAGSPALTGRRNPAEFWRAWIDAAAKHGLRWIATGRFAVAMERDLTAELAEKVKLHPLAPEPKRGRWIAAHRWETGETHAVVMTGTRLFHDPGESMFARRDELSLIGSLRLEPLSFR